VPCGFLDIADGFHCATGSKDAVSIFHPDHFMDLDEVEVVRLQALNDSSICRAAESFVRPSNLVMRKTFCR